MSLRTTVNHLDVDDEGLAALLEPRDDLLLERVAPADPDERNGTAGPGDVGQPGGLASHRFACEEGPFERYERTIEIEPLDASPHGTRPADPLPTGPSGAADATDDGTSPPPLGRHRVTETIRWELAIPLWGALFRPLIASQLRRHEAPPRRDPDAPEVDPPWWSPPARLTARSAAVLSRLCGLSMLAGYLGTTITQTLTYAAEEFGASNQAQTDTLAAVRAGVLLSLVLMAAADRRGRKRLLTVCAVGGAVCSALGALAPSLWVLGGTQTFARAFSTALALVITVVAAEEMPAGGRAYAASVLAMTAALGAGLAVALLPLADLGPSAWRIIYVVPILGIWWFVRVADFIPESRRFVRPHGKAHWGGHRARLALLAASGFFGLLFLAPVTQLQNEFLRDEHGFAGWQLTVFTFATSTPAGIGIIVGGRLADLRGRRMIGAIGTVGGALLLALAYQLSGPGLWVSWLVGSILAAMTVPALGVYGPELFPTALRGKANGWISAASVAGSAVGLRIAGALSDRWGELGPAIARLAIGPLIVAALVLAFYPETAHRELEEMNPEDALDPTAIAPPMG